MSDGPQGSGEPPPPDDDSNPADPHPEDQSGGGTGGTDSSSARSQPAPWYRHWWAAAIVVAATVVVLVGAIGIAKSRRTTKAAASPPCGPAPATASGASTGTAAVPSTASTAGGQPFPTSVSADHRYLLDQSGAPYLMLGDSPWSLSANLSTADMDYYFADRQAKGFNTALVGLLVDKYIGGRDDLSTYDGLYPFTSGTGTSSDLSDPNPAYWSRMDTMVRLARDHGITLMLAPVETGALLPLLSHNGTAKDFAYGAFLGSRYKNDPNIIWMSGNDYGGYTGGEEAIWAANDQNVTAVAEGIRSTDPGHLQTVELNGLVSTSFDNVKWPPLINLNGAYTYFPTYDEVLKAYNEPNPDPVFMVEANYEFENNGGGPATTDETIRRQEYWTMTSGATGQLYGNHYTWTLPSNWKSKLDTKAVEETGYMQRLMTSLPWNNLVPDQTHRVLTAGYGTCTTGGDVLQNDYATAASTSDGSLALIYTPTVATLTVDMSKFSGPVTARWYDPTSGVFSPVSDAPYPNVGSHQFTPKGSNSAGDGDWALVLRTS